MKNLFLIRHGKSSWADDTLRDVERPLNSRGEQQLRSLSRAARQLGAFDGLVGASSATRARQTLAGILPHGFPEQRLSITPELYTFDYRKLVSWLGAMDTSETLTVVGHNPALLELAGHLLGRPPERLPTGSLMHIWLNTNTDRNQSLKKNSGQLLTLLTPKDISYQQFARKRGTLPGSIDREHLPDLLSHHYQFMRDLENGVSHGFDAEFLHQYRIALRRSRAIAESLAELADIRGLGKAIKTLRRHARVTSTLRDLHVLINDRGNDLRAAGGALAFFQSLSCSHQHRLREHLHSGPYQRDMERWHQLIHSSSFRKHTRSLQSKDIQRTLAQRITRYNQQAAKLSEQSPDEDIHSLRKTLKRIRYLMELDHSGRFKSMKGVKKRQRWLGEFQDLHVQLELLQQFREHADATAENNCTRRAINDLIVSVERTKAEARSRILIGDHLAL